MVRKRVQVDDYDRVRRGRSEHIRGYSREQDVRVDVRERPSMLSLHRPGSSSSEREDALKGAIRELGVIQRRASHRNSTAPFVEAVDDLMASLRRGEPDTRIASDLATHTAGARSKGEFPGIVELEMEFAEDNPGYVAHGYITTIPGAYDRLVDVRQRLASVEMMG